ncbi:hypothetical protein FOA52_004617, partial [Chlamydomonas sp. UWO 241]
VGALLERGVRGENERRLAPARISSISTSKACDCVLVKAPQQDAHHLPPLQRQVVPHPEGDLQWLRVPLPQEAHVPVGPEGNPQVHHRLRPHALHEGPAAPLQERLPGGHRGQEAGRV